MWRDDGLYDLVVRDRLQHRSAGAGPRQRDLSACRAARFRADRGLHRDRRAMCWPDCWRCSGRAARSRSGPDKRLCAESLSGSIGSLIARTGCQEAAWVSPSRSRWIRSTRSTSTPIRPSRWRWRRSARGHALFHYLPQALTLRDGRLYARGRPLEVLRAARQPPPLRRFRGARPRRVRRRPDAPGPAVRHGLHHRDAPAGAAARGRRWSSTTRPRCATRRRSCSSAHFTELMPPTLITCDLRRDPRLLAASTATSSSSRCSAMAAPACSTCGRATRT